MELLKVKTKSQRVAVCPIGDIQWSGEGGPTAVVHVQRHIAKCLELEKQGYVVRFIGMGDYIDFLSPSNRQRLANAALYDSADSVITAKAEELTEEAWRLMLAPTKGKWLGLLEGHHFYETQGSTSDMWLAAGLDAPFLGTSAFVRIDPAGFVICAHHGLGGGILPTSGINKMYHWSAGLAGADVYLMGHNTKMGVVRLSRPLPNADFTDLTHHDVLLVNTGGFSKSNIVGHTQGRIRRGDYAEKGMMTPSPLAAPIVLLNGPRGKHGEGVQVLV
jgi:hypothetical protein